MEINYGLIAVARNLEDENLLEILHFCGYENRPKESDIEDLKRELENDSEFGLLGRTDYIIHEAAPEIINYYKKIVGDKVEGH